MALTPEEQLKQQVAADAQQSSGKLTPEQAVEQELLLEAQFGDQPLKAGVEGAIRGVTAGLSDLALTESGSETPEALRQRKERNPKSALLGEIGGTVATAVAGPLAVVGNLGTRAAIRGGAGLAGQVVAREAAQGAVIGAGSALSQSVLEDKPLTGQALIGEIGLGTALGVGGAALGLGVGASLPSLKRLPGKGWQKAKELVGDKLGSQVENFTNTQKGIVNELANGERVLIKKIEKDVGEKLLPDVQEYAVKELGFGALSNARDRAVKNAEVLKVARDEIGTAYNSLQDAGVVVPTAFARKSMTTPLEDLLTTLRQNPSQNKAEIGVVKAALKDINAFFKSIPEKDIPIGLLNERRLLQSKLAYKGPDLVATLRGKAAGLAERGAAQAIADAAELQAPELATQLKAANKKFALASRLESALDDAALRAPTLDRVEGSVGLARFGTGLAVRTGRQALVARSINKQLDATKQSIDEVLTSYAKAKTSSAAASRALRASAPALTTSGIAVNYDNRKAAKNDQEAFQNISKNLQALRSDENLAVDILAKTTSLVQNLDPEIASEMQDTFIRGVQFLDAKLPRAAMVGNLFQREYKPSSLEMAKFKRYVQVVEKPLTVLKELAAGTLTREHVEALRTVYPAIYRQMQQQVLANVESAQNMSYAKKLQLGTLLNIPADSSLEPDNFLQLQSTISQSQQPAVQGGQEVAQGVQPRAKGLDKLDLAGRAETGVQSVEKLR